MYYDFNIITCHLNINYFNNLFLSHQQSFLCISSLLYFDGYWEEL